MHVNMPSTTATVFTPPGRGRPARGRGRGCRGAVGHEHEPDHVGAGRDRRVDVLLAGEPADLDQRHRAAPRRARPAAPGSRISAVPTSTASAPASRAASTSARAADARLGDAHDRSAAGDATQLELAVAVDRERVQVARVHARRPRARAASARSTSAAVCASTSASIPSSAAASQQAPGLVVAHHRQDHQDRVGAGQPLRGDLLGEDGEVLGERRQIATARAGGREVVRGCRRSRARRTAPTSRPRPRRRSARAVVGDVGVRRDRALRRRGALDLGDHATAARPRARRRSRGWARARRGGCRPRAASR